MSIKSTIEITRKQAINGIMDRIIPTILNQYTNKQLEDLLEEMDEKDNNPFTNYIIIEEKKKEE